MWHVQRLHSQAGLVKLAALPSPVCTSVRFISRRNQGRRSRRELLGIDEDPSGGFQVGEELDEIESITSFDPQMIHMDFAKKEAVYNKRLMKKIIERKHFKAPQEVNLLTWDAKEQMRYLHQEFPDVWTVDKLAQSFPVSREGVIKILQSNSWQPKSLKELLKHDNAVHTNWKNMKEAGNQLLDGPIYSRYERLLSEGKLQLLAHADGIPSLPSPSTMSALITDGQQQSVVRMDGSFAAIIKEYCEETEKGALNRRDEVRSYKKLKSSNEKLIGKVVESSLKKHGLQVDVRAVQAELKEHFENESAQIENSMNTKMSAQLMSTSLLDVDFVPPERGDNSTLAPKGMAVEDHVISRRPRRQKGVRISQDLSEETVIQQYDKMSVEGTAMLKDEDNNEGLELLEYTGLQTPPKHRVSKARQEIMDSIQYDGDEKSDAYIYGAEKGYEFPFGRSDVEEAIDVNKPGDRQRCTLYRKGNSFYDENGEFLYRLP